MKLSSYMSLLSKRGLSTVVTTLIIVLLVIVAIGIIWAVIGNLIRTGSEEVNTGRISVSLDVMRVEVQPNGDVDVYVKRNLGEGDLSGVKLLLTSPSGATKIITESTIEELGESKFMITSAAHGLGSVKSVAVFPVIKTSSGKEIDGQVLDTQPLAYQDVVKSTSNLVAYWRFEGDADDEIGSHDGTKQGGVNCNVAGKVGNACDFPGSVSDYITIGGTPINIPSGNEWSVSFWVYVVDDNGFRIILGNPQTGQDKF